MKNKLLFLVLLLFIFVIFSYSAEKVIYFAKVTDLSDDVNLVSNCCIPVGQGFCITRFDALKGEAKIEIPFNKVKFVEVLSHTRIPSVGGYPCNITLTSKEKIKVIMKSYSFKGKTEFSDYYGIEFKKIKWIEFLHDGRYKKCPLCNTIFYSTELEYCKFCGEKLEKK